MNADDATRLGLGTVTHFYGLFESMYEHNSIQPWPVDMNYNDEQNRFGQVARQWTLVKPHGEKWNALLKRLQRARRDARSDDGRVSHRPRHVRITWPRRGTRSTRCRRSGTTTRRTARITARTSTTGRRADEVAWRNFYRVWMEFLNDYKNMGGRVTASSDAGFIYNTPGFSTIQEMELLQEAGFHPLEVIRSATYHAAETLAQAEGTADRVRRRSPGAARRPGDRRSESAREPEGALRHRRVEAQRPDRARSEQVGGVKWTIKDGIVYDAKKLLADVAKMVDDQRRARPAAENVRPR